MTIYPGTLKQALVATADVKAGDRLLLREGVFGDEFLSTLQGTQEKPIAMLPYLVENPIIDGSFYSRGQWQIIKGLEIKDADFTDRESEETGSLPSDIPQRDGVRLELTAANIRVENCVIHDCRQGMLQDTTSIGHEVYGCVIYYNGWSAPDRDHGHAIYLGNKSDTQRKITDCILYGQFGFGLHAFAEGTDWAVEPLRNIIVEGCTMFGNGDGNIIGGSGPGTTVRTSSLLSCYLYDNIQIGGASTGCTGFTLTNCVIVGNLTMRYYTDPPTITGNKFFGTVAITDGDGQLVDHETLFPSNEYLSAVPDAVYLRANDYDATRANLTIFNGSQANTVDVDVSAIYANGTEVQARNVQDYFTDIQTLTVTGGAITVNMQAANRTVAAPVGWTAPASTFPLFGCFVLQA